MPFRPATICATERDLGLSFAEIAAEPYWDETAYREFAAEVDVLDDALTELERQATDPRSYTTSGKTARLPIDIRTVSH
jgi:hypothetical protein